MVKLSKEISIDNEFKPLNVLRDFIKVISDETRLKILFLLTSGELCVCKIYDSLGLSQSLVSHHLAILRANDLVNSRKEGRWVYYSLNKETLGKFNDSYFAIFGVDALETGKINTLNCK